MFGLMQAETACSVDWQDQDFIYHRKHYCGTCKTMGQLYGHRSRFSLNFDTVFLAELLSELAEDSTQNWTKAYQAINRCMTMPTEKEQRPWALEYAATTNVLLAELKLEDNIQDSARKRWKWARWLLSSSFRKARKKLNDWGIDAAAFEHWVEVQYQRENQYPSDFESLGSKLKYYAEPTAEMTAFIFEQAVTLGEFEQEGLAAKMRDLGYHFGQLIYTLDALEDIEKDILKKQFNPLLAYYGREEVLKEKNLNIVRNLIISLQTVFIQTLENLPLARAVVERYAARMTSNLANRIYQEKEAPLTFKERWQLRWEQSQQIASRIICPKSNFLGKMNHTLVSLAVFVAPQATEDAVVSQGKTAMFTWLAFFTALFASAGIGMAWGRSRRKTRAEKKQERKEARFKQRLQGLWAKRKNCGNFFGCCGSFCINCGAILFWGGVLIITILIIMGIVCLSNGAIFWGLLFLILGVLGFVGLLIYVIQNPRCLKTATKCKKPKKKRRNRRDD
ncbi:MAG: DUF5685 family protein [Saprospiraceae bacterium]|nr:DUF5685 family protein [Saprospiraceae bacterium]